jgi:hypothetical protein
MSEVLGGGRHRYRAGQQDAGVAVPGVVEPRNTTTGTYQLEQKTYGSIPGERALGSRRTPGVRWVIVAAGLDGLRGVASWLARHPAEDRPK